MLGKFLREGAQGASRVAPGKSGLYACDEGAQMVKNPPAMRRPGFDPWVGKIPWRRKWQPTPVFLPGESQGRGSLVGCHLWGRTESDMTEVTLSRLGAELELRRSGSSLGPSQ